MQCRCNPAVLLKCFLQRLCIVSHKLAKWLRAMLLVTTPEGVCTFGELRACPNTRVCVHLQRNTRLSEQQSYFAPTVKYAVVPISEFVYICGNVRACSDTRVCVRLWRNMRLSQYQSLCALVAKYAPVLTPWFLCTCGEIRACPNNRVCVPLRRKTPMF